MATVIEISFSFFSLSFVRDLGYTEQNLEVEGAFIAIGHKPNTEFIKGQIECDENGYIKVLDGEMTKTSVEGMVFCVYTNYKSFLPVEIDRFMEVLK